MRGKLLKTLSVASSSIDKHDYYNVRFSVALCFSFVHLDALTYKRLLIVVVRGVVNKYILVVCVHGAICRDKIALFPARWRLKSTSKE